MTNGETSGSDPHGGHRGGRDPGGRNPGGRDLGGRDPHDGEPHSTDRHDEPGADVLHAEGVELGCDVHLPPGASGAVVFAHGSGSTRRSPRNVLVARALHNAGYATVLFDLLTPEEAERDARDASLRFDIALLTQRLVGVVDDVAGRTDIGVLPLGLFGASTGAAAALRCAAARPQRVAAVVSRGGRPDLAAAALPAVQAPTLLIVGDRDREVLRLNEQAAALMTAPHEVQLVAGATHLFEEPGALEEVARRAAAWFERHLRR